MSWQAYKIRNKHLRNMGFSSYRKYLDSPLWKSIRSEVMVANPLCWACRKCRAIEVHHSSYDLDVLQGRDLRYLIPLCYSCHDCGEFSHTGRKTELYECNGRLSLLRGVLNMDGHTAACARCGRGHLSYGGVCGRCIHKHTEECNALPDLNGRRRKVCKG